MSATPQLLLCVLIPWACVSRCRGPAIQNQLTAQANCAPSHARHGARHKGAEGRRLGATVLRAIVMRATAGSRQTANKSADPFFIEPPLEVARLHNVLDHSTRTPSDECSKCAIHCVPNAASRIRMLIAAGCHKHLSLSPLWSARADEQLQHKPVIKSISTVSLRRTRRGSLSATLPCVGAITNRSIGRRRSRLQVDLVCASVQKTLMKR
eukprot:UN0046